MESDAANICKHGVAAPTHCPPTCDCWCDACQDRYEEDWSKRVAEEHLCNACGMPQGQLTLERVNKFQYVHFYLPCRGCTHSYREFMKKEGLCMICRSTLPTQPGESCPTCSKQQAQQPPPNPFETSEGGDENRPQSRYGARPSTPRPVVQVPEAWSESLEEYTGIADGSQKSPTLSLSKVPERSEPSNE